MSVNALQESTVGGVFNEEALKLQFLDSLVRQTDPSTSFCADLSLVYSSSVDSNRRATDEADVYLGGRLRWGIQLFENGLDNEERVNRFTPNGRYSAFHVREYALVDFCTNESESTMEISQQPQRITVCFRLNKMPKCRCIFGGKELTIKLRD